MSARIPGPTNYRCISRAPGETDRSRLAQALKVPWRKLTWRKLPWKSGALAPRQGANRVIGLQPRRSTGPKGPQFSIRLRGPERAALPRTGQSGKNRCERNHSRRHPDLRRSRAGHFRTPAQLCEGTAELDDLLRRLFRAAFQQARPNQHRQCPQHRGEMGVSDRSDWEV